MRSLAVAIALLGIGLFGFIGRWFFTSGDSLAVPMAEVSLHGLGSISAPNTFKLENGVWNHVPWRTTPSGEYYYYTQIDIPQAIDPQKITFLLRLNARTVMGGVNKDDGMLMVTLFRTDPEAVDFRSYYEMLYPDATHPPSLRDNDGVWSIQGESSSSAYKFDRTRRAAFYLTASELPVSRAVALLEDIVESLKRNEGAIAAHFKHVEGLPQRIRATIAQNLAASNEELKRAGYAPLVFGKPQLRTQEVLFATEEVSRVGMPDAYIYRFQTLAIMDAKEGKWLAGKLYERSDMANLIALIHDGSWRTAIGSYLRHEVVEKAGLLKSAVDPMRVYFHIVHAWPLHTGPWRAQRLTHDARQFDDAIHRMELLRPYYRP